MLKLWETSSGLCIHELKGHTAQIQSVSFSRDGRRALSSSSDRSLRIWDLESARAIATFEDDAWVGSSIMPPDGEAVAYLKEGKELKIVYPATGRTWCAAKPEKGFRVALSLSPDERSTIQRDLEKAKTYWDRRIREL